MLNFLKTTAEWLRSALFPQQCPITEKEGVTLSDEAFPFVKVSDSRKILGIDILVVGTKYHDPIVEKIVTRWKFDGNNDLTPWLARQILEFSAHHIPPQAVLIPIPIHWSRRWISRGYDPVGRLIKALCNQRPDLCVMPLLTRVRRTRRQTLLSKSERETNLAAAFAVVKNKSPLPAEVWLVDDVVTTGSTLKEAAKILRQAGVSRINAVVFAQS